MKLFLTSHEGNDTEIAEKRAALERLAPRHTAVNDPDEADAILFLNTGRNKFRRWAEVLRADPVVQAFPEKCFVQDYSDRPIPFLPGLYVAMPTARVDPLRVRPVDSWVPFEAGLRDELLARTEAPSLLFSFSGADSAPVRRRIFDVLAKTEHASVVEAANWWNASDEERRALRDGYLEEIRNSAFVLCPRGQGTFSNRLYETMQLGRVPVILSDAWAAPSGPPWPDIAFRVAESRVVEIPALLRRYEGRAADMGAAALAA